MLEGGQLPGDTIVESALEQKNIDMDHLSNGYVLSRYFKAKADGRWYAVFEKE